MIHGHAGVTHLSVPRRWSLISDGWRSFLVGLVVRLGAHSPFIRSCFHPFPLRSYPFCWRSDTPLIYKAVPSWFVAVESIRDKLLKNNAQTYWVPSFVNEKRFQNW